MFDTQMVLEFFEKVDFEKISRGQVHNLDRNLQPFGHKTNMFNLQHSS